jgi:hypothetical protein
MSKLELLIKRCRGIWEELSVEPSMMDSMIDTFVKPDFDIDKITDEDIRTSTKNYINNFMVNLHKEKTDGNNSE